MAISQEELDALRQRNIEAQTALEEEKRNAQADAAGAERDREAQLLNKEFERIQRAREQARIVSGRPAPVAPEDPEISAEERKKIDAAQAEKVTAVPNTPAASTPADPAVAAKEGK